MGNNKAQGGWNGLIPPDWMIKLVGSNDVDNFKQEGEKFLCHFKKLGNLKPNEKVLEVGCGCGRMRLWSDGEATDRIFERKR